MTTFHSKVETHANFLVHLYHISSHNLAHHKIAICSNSFRKTKSKVYHSMKYLIIIMFPTYSFHHSYLKWIPVQDILSYLEKESILLQNMYVSFSYLIRTFFLFFLEFSGLLLGNINNSLFLVIFTSLPSSLPSLRSKYVKKGKLFYG